MLLSGQKSNFLLSGCFDNNTLSLARDKLSSKQFSMVSIRPAIEESLTVDPSIRLSFLNESFIFLRCIFYEGFSARSGGASLTGGWGL